MPSAYGLGTSKKPYAFYDLCPRPTAWAQVIRRLQKQAAEKLGTPTETLPDPENLRSWTKDQD